VRGRYHGRNIDRSCSKAMTVHPHFRRKYHLLYRIETGLIFATETSPSTFLPAGIGSISVDGYGALPTSKTHRIDVTGTPHALVELTDAERHTNDLPKNAEIVAAVAQELTYTDRFMMPDRDLPGDVLASWVAYRKTLRNLSKLDGALSMIIGWPTRPDGVDPI